MWQTILHVYLKLAELVNFVENAVFSSLWFSGMWQAAVGL